LFENEEKNGKMYGFTDNYIKVEADYDPLLINEITEVMLNDINSEGFALSEINYTQNYHVS
jgi:threonylcarbamoyladenosine tRNA methylthiotransferase MtaB